MGTRPWTAATQNELQNLNSHCRPVGLARRQARFCPPSNGNGFWGFGMKKTFRTSKRTLTVEIRELADRIEIKIDCQPLGELGDAREMEAILLPLLLPYDSDPRPNFIVNMFTGETATIYGDGQNSMAVITPPTSKSN